MAKRPNTKEAKNPFWINKDENSNPCEYQENCGLWVIDGSDITEALADRDAEPNEVAKIISKVMKKKELGAAALVIAIEVLKQVRANIEFEGYYEADILKLAEKVLKDEYKVNKYSYE